MTKPIEIEKSVGTAVKSSDPRKAKLVARFKAGVAGCTKVTDLKATNGHASARCLHYVWDKGTDIKRWEALGCFTLPMDIDGNDPKVGC